MSDNYEERAFSLIDAVIDYAIFRVSVDGIVETWNAGAARIKGYEAAEIIGRSIATFYTPEDVCEGRPAVGLQVAAREGRFEDEGWRLRKDGSRFRAHVIIDAIRSPQGALVGFAKITRDVSARFELERTKEQLVQAQKLEIVGHLTGGIAHDFNNLLTAILGCLDLVAMKNKDATLDRYLTSGRAAASRGQKLIEQLLAFSRKQTLWPEAANVDTFITNLQPLISQALGEKIFLQLNLQAGNGTTELDPTQFQSALLNLVLNARDAMPDGGQLAIRTWTGRPEQNGTPGNGQGKFGQNTFVVIEVHDTGVGMDPAVSARAIEPFFTTKEVGQGSGLGLSQVYGFTVQSGGEMQIESILGSGTSIRLVLPFAVGETPGPPPVRAKKRPNILIVEDDADVRLVAVEILSDAGFDVHEAENATQALGLLQTGIPLDLLFSDIVMPGEMNGVDLARRALHLRPGLQVMLTSGYAREALEARHGIREDVAFLPKPYRAENLRAMVKQLFERRSAMLAGIV